MNICLHRQRNDQGSVLLITLGITLVLGLSLASYLMLTRWQHVSVVRSQAWNTSMALAEGGIEEAMAQLNPSALIFGTNINRGANGWTLQPDGMYHAPRRYLPEGYYDVAMTQDTYPIIYATASVTIPTLSATITRTVKVTTTTAGVFQGAMAARENIDLSGNNITTDSFDSNTETYSTGGFYDPAKRKAGGDVASTEGFINAQNADIMGTLYTGPEAGYSVGAGGSVGDVGWVLGGNSGVQPGHYKSDFNMDFPDVLPPYQVAIAPEGDTIGGTNYTWILGYGNYLYDNPAGPAKFNSGDIILVVGRAKLYVTGDFIMGGQSSIIIAPGASLELYVGGANTALSTVNNQGSCASFSYYGLPGNLNIALSGNNSYLGTFYAPSADLQLSGGGSTTVDFQGACAVRSIQMNGHFNFHFDENLKRRGPVRGYQITSWTEI